VRRSSVSGRDEGSVTAEFAVGLPAAVLTVLVVLSVAAVGQAQLQCVDAARAGARQAARSETDGRALAVTRSAAPPGAGISLRRGAATVRVDVRTTVRLPLPGGLTVTVASHSVADLERTGEPW
jgi:Flp pilus assembly protein TadG